MPIFLFLFLLAGYWLSGFGVLTLFRVRLKPAYMVTLSLLLGVAVASFLPFVLQLFYIVITGPTVFGGIWLVALLLNIPSFLKMREKGFSVFTHPFFPARFRVKPYEIPYWLIAGFLIFVSVWRCYYLPPTSRDALSGPEAIAEYTVREQTMVNSFFGVDLWSTNNQFKSPFLISLQVIYKLAGFPFGQVWLSVIFVCFTVFVYHVLRERLHPVLAGLLLLLLMMTPEIYAYTFMILYDYSNMVFFCIGLYFLYRGLDEMRGDAREAGTGGYSGGPENGAELRMSRQRRPAMLFFSGLLLGIATYIRSETLILVLLFLPVVVLALWRAAGEGRRLKKIALPLLLFLLPALVGYYLPVQLYINHYLPVHYDIGGLFNDHLTDVHPLLQRYSDMVTHLLFGTFGIRLWGYLFYIGVALFVAELVFVRRFSREARFWLYSILVVYLALGLMGFVLPMFNLTETTKRAIFKLVPLVIFYMANNELLLRLSRWISGWETGGGGNVAVAAGAPGAVRAGKGIANERGTARDNGRLGMSGGGTSGSRKKNRKK